MKKIYSLIAALMLCVSSFAATETTVYYAIPSSVVGSYTVKLNVKLQGDADNWVSYVMSAVEGETYDDAPIYSCTFTDQYDGLAVLQFQLYDGDDWESQEQPISSWTSASVYNGKMKVYGVDGWINHVHDVTFPSGTTIIVDARAYGSGMNLFLPNNAEKAPMDNNWWWNSTSNLILFTLTADWTVKPSTDLIKSANTGWSEIAAGNNLPADPTYTKLVINNNGSDISGWEVPTTPVVTVADLYSDVSIAFNAAEAAAGTAMTITSSSVLTGNFTYSLSAVDANSNVVTLIDNQDGTYSFTMPSSNVIVSASGELTNASLTGFNGNWSETAYPMTKSGNVFTETLTLSAGTHQFKIVPNSWDYGKNWGIYSVDTTWRGISSLETPQSGDDFVMKLDVPTNVTFTFTYNLTKPTLDIVGVPVIYTVYFYDNLGWGDVYVNLYNGSYWNNDNGSGNNDAAVCNQHMTQIGETNYWKYEFTGGPYQYVSFTSTSQYDTENNHGYDHFHNIQAVYRGDFDATSENLMYVSTTESNDTKNGTAYYSTGVWMQYGTASYSFDVENTNYRTLCLPYAATLENATAYAVTEVAQGTIKISSVENLDAATPYIIKPAAVGTVTATFSGNPVSKLVNHAYMVGNLNVSPMTVEANGNNYVLSNNEFHKVVSGGDGVTIAQYKAFLYSETDLAPAQAPVRIVVEESNATDVEAVEASEEAVKFIENGQLFIRKNGVVYDVTGAIVR